MYLRRALFIESSRYIHWNIVVVGLGPREGSQGSNPQSCAARTRVVEPSWWCGVVRL